MIVLDSSFLIAYHNQRDVHHDAAVDTMVRLLDGEWGPALLPEYVFLEVTTVVAVRLNLDAAAAVGETLLAAGELEFIPCSSVFLDAFDTFRQQSPTALSFADAAILTIARQREARHIATFDQDFRDLQGIAVVPE